MLVPATEMVSVGWMELRDGSFLAGGKERGGATDSWNAPSPVGATERDGEEGLEARGGADTVSALGPEDAALLWSISVALAASALRLFAEGSVTPNAGGGRDGTLAGLGMFAATPALGGREERREGRGMLPAGAAAPPLSTASGWSPEVSAGAGSFTVLLGSSNFQPAKLGQHRILPRRA